LSKSKIQKVSRTTDMILTESVEAINHKLGPNAINKKVIIDRLVIEYAVNGLYNFFTKGPGNDIIKGGK
jgi:hypothetical protein